MENPYPESIAVYHEACDKILSWMPEDGWLHQNDFDAKAYPYEIRGFPMVGVTPKTIMLGDIYGSGQCVTLVLAMCGAGFVEQRKSKKGGFEYRASRPRQDEAE